MNSENPRRNERTQLNIAYHNILCISQGQNNKVAVTEMRYLVGKKRTNFNGSSNDTWASAMVVIPSVVDERFGHHYLIVMHYLPLYTDLLCPVTSDAYSFLITVQLATEHHKYVVCSLKMGPWCWRHFSNQTFLNPLVHREAHGDVILCMPMLCSWRVSLCYFVHVDLLPWLLLVVACLVLDWENCLISGSKALPVRVFLTPEELPCTSVWQHEGQSQPIFLHLSSICFTIFTMASMKPSDLCIKGMSGWSWSYAGDQSSGIGHLWTVLLGLKNHT